MENRAKYCDILWETRLLTVGKTMYEELIALFILGS